LGGYDFLLFLQFLPIFMESVGIVLGFVVVGDLLKQRNSFRHLSSKTETSWKMKMDDTVY
jgi:hypothetical protein